MCGTFVRCWSSTGTKPCSSTRTPAASAPETVAVGTAADRDEDPGEEAGTRLAAVVFHGHHETVLLRLDAGHPGRDVNALQTAREAPLERANQIAVDAGQKLRQQFDDRHAAAESGVDRRHLEADNAAADHEQPAAGIEAGIELQGVR